jgi:hypothetical protein
MAECGWLQLMQGLLTPVIALVTAYIAYQQWLTNKDKVKLDKFDRRFAIYDAARELRRAIRQHAQATEDEIFNFRMKTRDAVFLLDDDLRRYLEDLGDKAWQILMMEGEIEHEHDKHKREKLIDDQRALKDWIADQADPLRDKFRKYLSLRN